MKMSRSLSSEVPELIPDVILEILSKGNLTRFWNLQNLRLLSKTWNAVINGSYYMKSHVVLHAQNIQSFSNFISGPSFSPQISSLNSLKLKLDDKYETVLHTFLRLPDSFRSQLLGLELSVETDAEPEPVFCDLLEYVELAQLDGLEDLIIMGTSNKDHVPLFPSMPDPLIILPEFHSLKRLTIPLHCSIPVLQAAPQLTSLTLHVYNVELQEAFWDDFIVALYAGLTDLVILDKRREVFGVLTKIPWARLTGRRFRLRRLVLELPFLYQKGSQEPDLCQLLTQQAPSLRFLGLPPPVDGHWDTMELTVYLNYSFDFILRGGIRFRNLRTLGFDVLRRTSASLLQACPAVTKVIIPDRLKEVYWRKDLSDQSPFENIGAVEAGEFKPDLLELFPNTLSLVVRKRIREYKYLRTIFTEGLQLRRLEVKLGFNRREICVKVAGGDDTWIEKSGDERMVRLDCFLLGLRTSYCKKFYAEADVRLQSISPADFEQTEEPAVSDLAQLEYLSLEGCFTELTVWAGIAKLTKLKQLDLTSIRTHKLQTFLELEAYLPNLERWSITKLTENYPQSDRKLYMFSRVLPNGYGPDQILVTKFHDNHTEQSIVPMADLDKLDLSYTGELKSFYTKVGTVSDPDEFPDSDSDSVIKFYEDSDDSESSDSD